MPKKLHSQITFHLANFETRSEKLAFIKSLQAIVDSFEEKLNAENELMQKQEEFSDFLESVTEEVASIISRKIFDRYVILKSSVERMDYRYTYQGEFEIKNLHFEHYAYDEDVIQIGHFAVMENS
jgi:predicted transcriptional regulator